MPCPRWDSNAIHGPVSVGSCGNMRIPGQSDGCTGKCRGGRCAHCAHLPLSPSGWLRAQSSVTLEVGQSDLSTASRGKALKIRYLFVPLVVPKREQQWLSQG